MAFHNPFIKDGLIKFPDNGSLVRHVERWAKVRGDKLAYRFVDFSTERDGIERDLNWADFGTRNKAVGARLQQVTAPGDRVAILCPQNLDYLVAMYGSLYAGRIAVPLFDPNEPGHVGRLHAVLDDCQPSAILTTTEAAEGVRKFFRSRPAKERPRVIAVDAIPDEVGATWEPVDVQHDTIAYLQYTSGSTRVPTGVQITHLNLATNVVQVIEALDGEEGDRGVSWLPFFHDMGLITAMVSPMIGHYVTFMTPAAFVRRPGRWIREMARKPDDTGGVISVAPNFAFDHAAARGVPKDGEEPLDLSNVKAVLNGSEPISAATVRRFNEAFAPYGFQEKAIKPSYGLAEATLFVSTTLPGEPPRIVYVDRDGAQPTPIRRGARRFAQGRRRRHRQARSESRSGPPSSTPTPPPKCPTARSARSGSVARTWGPATGARKKRSRDLPEHPQVADQPVPRRGRPRRRDVGSDR